MKRVAVGVVIVVLAVGGGWWWSQSSNDDGAAAPSAQEVPNAARGPAGRSAASGTPAADRSPKRVIRHANAVEQRRQLMERIAAARARRAAATAPVAPAEARPASGVDMQTPDQVLVQMQAAFREVKAHVSECVDRSPTKVLGFKADLALIGDPDVGTLIDASALESTDGTPLPAAFDDCVRGIMQALELPPIGLGDEFKVNYVFTF
ncbi:MAG: hypothetical protein H0T89_04870 [Deltaproteobacteria bacterium]|nr:hypothetical protein [Deltaproteobacteria bacterium]